jgi:NAD(P)-dependent dehydrogenase (short-subunit alcohol dehydrogenase family)
MRVCILGDKSDIAQGLIRLLKADGHDVWGWNRESQLFGAWNLIISCLGSVAPVGTWNYAGDWRENFESNIFTPIDWLKTLWSGRLPNSSVCFMAGSNPQKIMRGYAPYNASKMALLKIVEQLDFEEPGVRFFALGPGYMETKIHGPTHKINWPNERIAKGNPNTIEQVYDCLKWCVSQPKDVVGGRNICVSDSYGAALAERLKHNQNLFKLRRVE